MEIQRSRRGEVVELRMLGRFDAAWSAFVANAIDEVVRAGCHRIELHMAAVDYMSSAAIRVLVRHFKQLQAIRGSLAVTNPSQQIAEILRMAGLGGLVHAAVVEVQEAPAAAAVREVEHGALRLQLHGGAAAAAMHVDLHGDPQRVVEGRVGAADCSALDFPADTWGVGIGALGAGYADCEARFGEFLALGGAAATLPTDGSGVADFVQATGQLVPRVHALTAVRGSGRFSSMLRFEPLAAGSVVGISAVLDAVMRQCDGRHVAVAIAAEAGCVVGAHLLRSPAMLHGKGLHDFPSVRDHLSVTTERDTERSTILACGIVSRDPGPVLGPHVRPLGTGSALHAHLHALVFPYRPLQAGVIELDATVRQFLEGSLATSLVHLLADDRPYEGIGETEMFRGALWFAPVSRVNGGLA